MNASPSPNLAGRLTEAFPTAGQIPAECRLDTRSYERLYLINGELREWTGPLAEISSPICLREGGALRRPVIGSVPAMDEAAALAALEAAARAWDDGRGHWPTLTRVGPHRGGGGFRGPHAGRARRGGEAAHVGDRQEPGRQPQGVRPHGGLHPQDHRGPEGHRPHRLALQPRWRRDRPGAPRAAGRVSSRWGRSIIR